MGRSYRVCVEREELRWLTKCRPAGERGGGTINLMGLWSVWGAEQ